MKRIVPASVLPNSIYVLVFLLTLVQFSSAQDCRTLAANKPSVTTRGTDDVVSNTGKMNTTEMSKMKPHLTKAEIWIKKMLTNFTGAKLLYYNNYFPAHLPDSQNKDHMFVASGIKSHFSAKMMFFAYYCYDNSSTIHTEGESGSTIYVHFNNVFASGFTSDAGVYTVNGKSAFKTIRKKRSEGRTDFYEQKVQNNATGKMYTANEYIIFRNSDKPLFIPVTRKEYLQQMLKDVDVSGTSNNNMLLDAYESNKKMFELEMKVYKEKDKSYTPEKEAKRRKWFEEDQEKLKTQMSKASPNSAGAKEVILQYLQKPSDWLNKTLKDFYYYSSYSRADVSNFVESLDKVSTNGLGEVEEVTLEEIVTINPAYFNKSFTSDVPQVITLHLRNGSYAHMQKVSALIQQSGALAPLEAILYPAKSTSTVVAPTNAVSNYSLKYLSKLITLTPLTTPAGMKPSTVPVTSNYTIPAPSGITNFIIPVRSQKLTQLPQLLNADRYDAYVNQLHTAISGAIKPNEKTQADDYVRKQKINQSTQLSNSALAAWLQNKASQSLYLYSKAVIANPADVLAANNFSAFLIMGGLAEKSIPILEYWNRQKPGESSILANLGNAYYRLGDPDNAMKYLQQAVQKDSLHPTANKILCMMYLKKGDTKKAKDHGTRSLTGSYDEQVVSLLRQIDNQTKPGEIMSRFPANEFPLLKRTKLPAMPTTLDDMEKFAIDLEVEKKSLEITIADIESKMPRVNDEIKQQVLMASLTKGLSPFRTKAQYIITDAMQTYQREMIKESDVFNYNLKLISAPYSAKVKAISKKYGDQLNKLEGGEAGDEDKISALEFAKCREINAEKEKYLAQLATLINSHAQRLEYISRKFYADYANWAPYWMPETTIPFPGIERDYLKDVLAILNQYPIITKENCTAFEPLPKKEGKLQKWEDEYCANFKGKIAMGVLKITFTCNSFGIEGGEGVVGELELKFADDGSFEDFTVGAGVGETWTIGEKKFAGIEASASIKEFIKFGKNKTTGEWEVKDFGLKEEITLEGKLGKVSGEIKVLEFSASVNAGMELGGIYAPLLNLNRPI